MYRSEIKLIDGDKATIEFVDDVARRAVAHIYRCRQTITVDPATGLITHIDHHELPGEREALYAYFSAVGVSR